jgi:AbrB family looped-hinge helix DNA binding protein
MARYVTLDEKGRIVLPSDTRRRAGLKPGSKLLVEVRGAGITELRDYNTLSSEVQRVAAKKLTGWREEEHREEKLLTKLSKDSENATR